jgi:hypothetical protein
LNSILKNFGLTESTAKILNTFYKRILQPNEAGKLVWNPLAVCDAEVVGLKFIKLPTEARSGKNIPDYRRFLLFLQLFQFNFCRSSNAVKFFKYQLSNQMMGKKFKSIDE